MRMSKKVCVTWLPSRKKTTATRFLTVLQAAQKERVVIPSRCAGVASCLLCTVCISNPDAVNAVTEIEQRKLGPLIDEGVRLACQTRIAQDVSIVLRASSLQEVVRRLLDQSLEEDS